MDTSQGTAAANRARLVARLREGVPDWDFGNCSKCALGVAFRIGLLHSLRMGSHEKWRSELLRVFGVDAEQTKQIFGLGRPSSGLRPNSMTPDLVADALERIDAQQEEPVSHLTGREQDAAAGLVPLSSTATTPASTLAAREKARLDPFPARALHYSGDGG